ncbi:MAG: PDZ domain-containing protein [Planctomycetota bacterium]|nr:MAG: PDZ domain-containing protein [Planctomycetota bacterium]
MFQPPPPPPPSRPGRGPLLLALAALAMALVASWRAGLFGFGRLHDPAARPRTVAARGDLAEEEKATIELFQAAAPAVVNIRTTELRRNPWSLRVVETLQGEGSGFVWDERGYIVTNFHVIREANFAYVSFADGREFRARLVGSDPTADLAVLKIDGAGPLPVVPLGESESLQVGQRVFAIGNPFGLDHTLTTGVVSGLGREIVGVAGNVIRGVIQTDAAINPGNSGGPLLDSAGRLIGVNTAIKSPTGASAGIGFAVPADTVNRVVPEIIRTGRPPRAVLGITMLDDAIARANGIDGVVVSEVLPGGPADRAGIRPLQETADGRTLLGDVILGVGGTRVHSRRELILELASHRPGEEVEVLIERDGREIGVKVRLDPD